MRNKHKTQHISVSSPKESNEMTYSWSIIPISFAVLLGYAHMRHVGHLFESDKHFSHLSNLERELSFRTESGLYYYYFKNLVVDHDLNRLNSSLIHSFRTVFLNDNRTEYPNTINSLQRFNLYPELVLAVIYRILDNFGLLKKTCWKVNRGDGMPPVDSCEGLLEPIYFYSHSVFLLHGFLVFFLFVLCFKLNHNSMSSGLIACICYFYNHSEATRVMWVPALRESFSFPFHLLQIISLINLIRSPINRKSEWFFIVSTLSYLLPWQFAQFSLATQLLSLFAAYSLGFLERHKFIKIVRLKTVTLSICFVLMFANRMLLSSLYASLLCSTLAILMVESRVSFLLSNEKWHRILINSVIRLLALFTVMFLVKKILLDALLKLEDDSHIWDILKSKINPLFQTFDTRLYTCAKEFDFIEFSTIQKLTTTLLIPISVVNVAYLGGLMAKKIFMNESKNNEDAIVVYILFQLVAYGLMAAFIMRLKLFWTPFLCLIASYVGSKSTQHEYLSIICTKKHNSSQNRYMLLVLFVALMSYQGIANLKEQYKIIGEYSSYDMELMMKWIQTNTKPDEAFVGPMSSMANVKLSTNRPIVNHPHYEDIDLRNRTKYIYSFMYGYLSPKHLYKLVRFELKATYVLIEEHYCRSAPPGKSECELSVLAQLFLGNTSSDVKACEAIMDQNDITKRYFSLVFKKGRLNLFKVAK